MGEIELCGVNYIYNCGTPFEVHALKDINLTIGGGITGIIGHTGSGKSTLVQLLMRYRARLRGLCQWTV